MFKKSWQDAKKVVSRGNMFMLAIGMLLGAAFGAVIKSLANDVIMQAIAKALGFNGVQYMSYGTTKWKMIKNASGALVKDLPINGVMYGKFLSALVAFLIIVFFIFLAVLIVFLIINYKHRNDAKPAPAGPTTEELILEELKILNASNTTTTKASTKKEKSTEEKAPAKKETKKAPAKKAPAKKATAKKPVAKKTTAKKAPAKKTAKK